MSKLVDQARKYVGIKEIGNNSGFRLVDSLQNGFEGMMRKIGWKQGYAWCAFFVKTCVMYALGEEYAKDLSGGVLDSWVRLQRSAHWQVQSKPVVGAVVFWDAGGGKGHCGIIIAVPMAGSIVTIEGNTNDAGSRDGDGVYVKQRKTPVDKKTWKLLGYASPITNEDNTTGIQPS